MHFLLKEKSISTQMLIIWLLCCRPNS